MECSCKDRSPPLHKAHSGTDRYLISPNASIGANSPLGIGRASAYQFASNGAQAIYLCDSSNEHLAVHRRELQSFFPRVDVHCRQFDAADEPSIKAVVDEAVAKYGRLDIMFANAGVSGTNQLFPYIKGEDFMKTMRTNVLR